MLYGLDANENDIANGNVNENIYQMRMRISSTTISIATVLVKNSSIFSTFSRQTLPPKFFWCFSDFSPDSL